VAIYHCTTKPVARKSGRSAVAAASYRSGERLNDERLGMVHDYTRRGGIENREIPIVLPTAVDGKWTRERLWNAAEKSEKRCDARTAREWEVAFPAELSAEGRKVTAVAFARSLADRYGCAVDVALHLPGAKGDQRNYHAHLLTTTRKIDGAELGEKTALELSNAKRDALGLGTTQSEIEAIRATWAEVVNAQLEQEGQAERIDHRTLAAQEEAALDRGDVQAAAELHREPLPRLTRNVMQIERRGFQTEAGDRRREVEHSNAIRAELMKETRATAVEIAALEREFDAREKAALAERQRQAAELVKQAQGQPRIDPKKIEERAQTLWVTSPAGQAQQKATKQYEDDQWWAKKYQHEIDDAKFALAAWKNEHPFKSLTHDNHEIIGRIQDATRLYGAQQKDLRSAYEKTLSYAERKVAAWPALLKQAAEDLKQIVVKLLPEDVRRLILDTFDRDPDQKHKAAKAFEQLQNGSPSIPVWHGIAQVKKDEHEGFVATLRQLDKPNLDEGIEQLRQYEGRQQKREREKQAELEWRQSGRKPKREMEM
jgi:hypothetical protein